jgi:hypothetical protein
MSGQVECWDPVAIAPGTDSPYPASQSLTIETALRSVSFETTILLR